MHLGSGEVRIPDPQSGPGDGGESLCGGNLSVAGVEPCPIGATLRARGAGGLIGNIDGSGGTIPGGRSGNVSSRGGGILRGPGRCRTLHATANNNGRCSSSNGPRFRRSTQSSRNQKSSRPCKSGTGSGSSAASVARCMADRALSEEECRLTWESDPESCGHYQVTQQAQSTGRR